MLFPTTSSLKERIIRILAHSASQKAGEIRAQLVRQKFPVSIQGVYKELRNLQRDGVVVKAAGRFDLHLAWILNLSALTDLMFESHLENLAMERIQLPERKKKQWHFTKLRDLNEYWGQLMLILLQRSKTNKFYQWIPRPWFQFLSQSSSEAFQEALKIGGYKVFTAITGDTYLEKEFRRHTYLPKENYEIFHAPSPFHDLRDTYLSLLDDYLITVRVSPRFAKELDSLFDTIQEPKTSEISKVHMLLNRKDDFTLSLEQNTSSVRDFRRKILNYLA